MKQELEERLYQQFPWLEIRNIWSGKKLGCCVSMDCEDGWYDIIYNLCNDIDSELKNCSTKFIDDFFVEQIKEKYATLRFYVTYGTKNIYKLIENAEEKSAKTCERCGEQGKLCIRGTWYKTLCDSCKQKHGYTYCSDAEEM